MPTAAVPVLAAIQPLHGFAFALLHLTAMHLIAKVVPQRLSASAQTIYDTLGLGVASAVLTATSGLLYGAFGADAFWTMAALCVLAFPLIPGLHRGNAHTERHAL
ncbi:hypothetical protein MOR12E_24335 [Methylobacterium oryzae]